MSNVTIKAHDDHPVVESALVDDGIGRSNDAAAPLHEVKPLSCFAFGDAGAVVGGAVGRRWGACCELQQLWVEPGHRHRGIATNLMAAFELHARSHGCESLYLETFSFQAPGFYRSLGYVVVHENELFPHGIVKYLMVKKLSGGASASWPFAHADLHRAGTGAASPSFSSSAPRPERQSAGVGSAQTPGHKSMPTALLIIDVQQVLCSGGNVAYDVAGIIDRINLVSRKARAAGALVVVIQHETMNGDMDYGTDGWSLAPALEVCRSDVYLRKTATDSFHKTGLDELLQSRGITNLLICGLQSEFCVDTTTRRAMALGYSVVLVADGHSTVDNGILSAAQISAHHNRTLSSIESFGPRTVAVPAGEIDIFR